ncbi:MAG: glucosamine-6-phosphate deaminase [Sphingobacteriales bacterium SCN 48-20]|uniref:glucosamine-6-phosphate deaminase n=1 Tax=Terrimonas ferruginea TaxID=249 RepID=UPI00086CBBFE|nr:glucosamine-6-phosphate deaminase [Terrimonas ferruginea]MBN8783775.1 glucosamine-6-phosphate deaminase [Terrimonas ferruginea]ODT90696.1 MAG: glucosamine-6-phosphate deaminase [Sphingobacteriales bacterium SCN 48-20]OJW40821.1 MAG: glucosamine-6-phosphate deaminase [Sphingobacteriales bacterium 48-107]
MRDFAVDQLKVKVYGSREEMGKDAALKAAATIRELLQRQEEVNIIFAAAASQEEFLKVLIQQPVEWNRVNAFHMDEYTGLPAGAPQLFGYFLRERLFDKVDFREVYYIDGQATDKAAECARYAALLQQHPVDITCMGIGENTHLAFNDPHVAHFDDPYAVKIVDLDEACKQQQVNEGCFAAVPEVPSFAYTLTIPALLAARYIYCMVPGASKAQAVYHTLTDAITELYPSTILRKHEHAELFLDKESAALYLEEGVRLKV